jgi:hypothetical protein
LGTSVSQRSENFDYESHQLQTGRRNISQARQ